LGESTLLPAVTEDAADAVGWRSRVEVGVGDGAADTDCCDL